MLVQRKNKSENLSLGILLMLVSALLTSTGQLLWKMSGNEKLFLLLLGFILYGLGAVIMTTGFKFGDISILHPMLGSSLVLSIFYGYIFLDERITVGKIAGVGLILAGLICLGASSREGETTCL